jgi:hypothetical protein
VQIDSGAFGVGCANGTGSFVIRQLEFDSDDQLTKLAGSFEVHCNGRAPALYGSIAYRADDAPPPVSHAPPSAVANAVAVGGLNAVRLSWTNPTDGDFDHVVVYKYTDSSSDVQPPGRLVYSGPSNTVLIDHLGNAPGVTEDLYMITPINAVRAAGPTTTLFTSRTTNTVSNGGYRTVKPGTKITLAGEVDLAYQNRPGPGLEVDLARNIGGDSRGPVLARARTDGNGQYQLTFPATTSGEYVAYFPGAAGYIGAVASAVDVGVTPTLTAKVDHSSGKAGSTFHVTVSCTPVENGVAVLLQRWTGNAWSTVATTKFAKGKAAFAVKRKTKGTDRYRVIKYATNNYTDASVILKVKTT